MSDEDIAIELEAELEKELSEITTKAARSPSVTLDLCLPVKFNSVERNEITLRRATVGDQLEYKRNKDGDQATIDLVARLAGVKSMDVVDLRRCDAAIAGFFLGRPPRAK
jgi:hypothetical protein